MSRFFAAAAWLHVFLARDPRGTIEPGASDDVTGLTAAAGQLSLEG
jgi:hypothetical protein